MTNPILEGEVGPDKLLIQELRKGALGYGHHLRLLGAAADRIEALEAQIAQHRQHIEELERLLTLTQYDSSTIHRDDFDKLERFWAAHSSVESEGVQE